MIFPDFIRCLDCAHYYCEVQGLLRKKSMTQSTPAMDRRLVLINFRGP
jgi:hypothetical protein